MLPCPLGWFCCDIIDWFRRFLSCCTSVLNSSISFLMLEESGSCTRRAWCCWDPPPAADAANDFVTNDTTGWVFFFVFVVWTLTKYLQIWWVKHHSSAFCHQRICKHWNYLLMNWKFPMMLMQHSVRIWFAVQHSVKNTASWLVDAGK